MADFPPPPQPLGGEQCAGCDKEGLQLLVCDDCVEINDGGGAQPPPAAGKYCAPCMIGRKVRVFWPLDENWYVGVVQQFDAATGEHLLVYPDGDTEWVRIGENNGGGGGEGAAAAGGGGPQQPQNPPQTPLPPGLEGGEGVRNDASARGAEQQQLQMHQQLQYQQHQQLQQQQQYQPEQAQSLRPMEAMQQQQQQHLMQLQMPPPPQAALGGGWGAPRPQPGAPPSAPFGHPHPSHYGVPPVPPHGHGHAPPAFGGLPHPGQAYPLQGHQPHQFSPHPYGYHPGMQVGSMPLHMAHGGAMGADAGSSKRKQGPKTWTKEEDQILLNLVKNMRMPMKWSVVAQRLQDRTGKQCRERYVNHLNPRLKTSEWTAVEDSTIFRLYDTSGSQWAKHAKMIPGRTDNGIKNRFHNLRRQLEREDEHRLRLSKLEDFPGEVYLEKMKKKLPDTVFGKSADLWKSTNVNRTVGVIAALSVLGASGNRTHGQASSARFGPFRPPQDAMEQCARCGLYVPSIQTGDVLCSKTKWCIACTRIPPHLGGDLLREVLRLRKTKDKDKLEIIDSWSSEASSTNVKEESKQ